ncbi:Ku protein [Streptomyces sp. NPDC056121]|uniref:Ku protein n=1 Tax=unclassified Streptomyces TaxID=2593676 RepID=UPI0035DF0878
MRALCSGMIQFGLVVLPVKLFSATDEHQVRLREIHAADSDRVQHRRFCEAEDREIGYEEVGRGWELPLGTEPLQ